MALMNVKKTIYFAISLCVFTITISTITAADTKNSSNFWKNIFIDHVNNFEYHSRDIDYLIYKIHDDLEEFRVKTKEYDTKYHQLKFIMNNVINNPYEYRLIITEMTNLARTYTALYDQIKTLDSTATTYISSLREMEKDLSYLTKEKFRTPAVLAASTRLLFDVKILTAHLKLEKNKINLSLASMKDLIEKLTGLSIFLKKSFVKQLQIYFLIPGPTIWDINWGDLLPYSFNSWIKTMPTVLRERFPDEKREYMMLAMVLGAALLIYLIFHYLLIKKINIKAKIPGAYELLLRALAAFFIFVGLVVTSSILIFPETVLFYRLAVVIFGFFACFFSMALKIIQCPDSSDDSLLSTLFILFSCGIFYQILGIGYVLLAILWPITISVAGLFLSIKTIVRHKTIINKQFWFFIPVAAFFFILCINGYIYLSIFCSMIWFLTVVSFRLGTALSWILKNGMKNSKAEYHLLKAIVTGIGVPLIWLLIIISLFFWASMQISSNSYILLTYLINLKIGIHGHQLQVFNLTVAIFLFFVFKCFISCFIEYLAKSSYANQTQRQQVLPSLKSITRYTGWIIYIIAVMIIFDVNITSILVVLGGLSVGIGLGLQTLISNFVCGLMIIFGKICRPGDVIELDGVLGTVIKTEIRNTTIKTLDNCIITVPNSHLLDTQLHNWTRNNDLVRKDITVGVGYDSDVDMTTKILMEVAENFEEICKTPKPKVLFHDFGDNALIFCLRIWLHDIDNIFVVPSNVRYAINKRFRRNGINIAYPQLDIHVKDTPVQETKKKINRDQS
jgi:potassium-dependent mechanosensitive channel